MSRAIERILLTLWVGSLWAAGYLVAPVLFAMLDTRLAADVAGRLFGYVALIGLAAGSCLVLLALRCWGLAWLRNWRCWCLALMLALTAAAHFGVAPQLAALRQAAQGELDAHPSLRRQFDLLHHTAGLMYVANSLLGMVLIVAGTGRRHRWRPEDRDS